MDNWMKPASSAIASGRWPGIGGSVRRGFALGVGRPREPGRSIAMGVMRTRWDRRAEARARTASTRPMSWQRDTIDVHGAAMGSEELVVMDEE